MGTWDERPFGNDTAADFSHDLDETAEADRPAAIREALSAAVMESEYLDRSLGDVAIAAAAIVAAQCPGGLPTDSVYGPRAAIPPLPADLRLLAVQALDRVTGENSESAELWDEGDRGPWRERVRQLKEILSEGSLQVVRTMATSGADSSSFTGRVNKDRQVRNVLALGVEHIAH